ncbi:hypothetical protein N9M66_00355 [Litoreibacter sp.]|nr:hypothetical protein [Litoreibacter sp.]
MTTQAISRSNVMTRAWADFRFLMKEFGYAMSQRFEVFAMALRDAWAAEKSEVALVSRTVGSLRAEINDIENRTRMRHGDFAHIDAIRGAIRRIEAAEQAADFAEKRELIESAKGRFCSVTFIKADGSERTMKVQPSALKFHVKGEAASEASKKAVATRKSRHPHLLPVWDVEAQAVRSVNLATIQTIALDGLAHAY